MRGERIIMQIKRNTVNKKLLYFVIILVIAAVTAVGTVYNNADYPLDEASQTTQEPQSSFQVHYIDVGQGDCSLIVCDGKTLLIDAGENGHETEVINYLRSMGVVKLDYIIATHQHSDHIGGLPEVIEEFGMANLIMPRLTQEQTPTNSTYTAFLEAIKGSGAKVIASKAGASYSLGTAKFEIFGPVTNDVESLNSMSVVTKVTYGENSFLFTGDAETDEEREIIETGANLDSDVLKVGHHGSKTSSCTDFLDAVSPEICVILCGADNDYGHPHKNITKRIAKYTDKVYRTDICGSIVITSDGEKLDVSYDNQ